MTGESVDEIQFNVNKLQSAIDSWVKINGLKLNINKTKYMVFTNKKIYTSSIEVLLDGTKIKKVKKNDF